MKNPQKILITILIGNLLVNLFFSAITTTLFLGIWGEYGHFISIALVTPLIIIFCEITPKIVSINTYTSFSRRVIPYLNFFHGLFFPLREIFLLISNLLTRLFRIRVNEGSRVTEEELKMAVTMGESEGVIKRGEGRFIKNVLRFSRKEASNVMYPRNQMIFIPLDTTIEEAVDIFLENRIIRAPVYKDDMDTIVGVLDSRALVPYVQGLKKTVTINKLVHSVDHYPASKELGGLLSEFLEKKTQIAVVIDEYGGTDGVVTLSSILSELMGKKFTQWEQEYKPKILSKSEKASVISGDMQVHDFNDNFGENIQTTESETIAGYMIEVLGHFPKRAETIKTKKHILKVKQVLKNRIKSIEIVVRD